MVTIATEGPHKFLVAFGRHYILRISVDLDTPRVPNRSPPHFDIHDFLGGSDDIWGARGPHFRPILGVPGVRAGLHHIYFLAL